jgi:hypothetical protein
MPVKKRKKLRRVLFLPLPKKVISTTQQQERNEAQQQSRPQAAGARYGHHPQTV